MQLTMSALQLGDRANIISLEASSAACRQKLFACGMLPGTTVSVVRIAPFGDPMQIKISDDIMLSIRKSEACDVTVAKI